MINKTYEYLLTIPDRLEATIELGKLFMSSDTNIRSQIKKNWNKEIKWIYPSASHLSCENYEIGTPEERITATLILNSIESHEDIRDQLMLFCIAYHSCIFANIDPDQLFEEIAEKIGGETGTWLLDFKNRDDSDKALEGFLLYSKKEEDCVHIYPNINHHFNDLGLISIIEEAFTSK